MKVSIFCGGRGSSEIIKGFLKVDNIALTLIVNGYDDGKSTGRIRSFVKGMLGPSDFRKNISTILAQGCLSDKALGRLLEFRINSSQEVSSLISIFSNGDKKRSKRISHFEGDLHFTFNAIDLGRAIKFTEYLTFFINFSAQKNKLFDYSDCAIGNLIFAGAYIKNKMNFNLALKDICDAFEIRCNVINVSDGENVYLNVRTNNNRIISDEGDIVENIFNEEYSEIFLSKHKLNNYNIKKNLEIDIKYYQPKLGCECRKAIKESDIIIYGPGTQFSSLIPSYLTRNILHALYTSKALKFAISNLNKDKDVIGMDINKLFDLISRYSSYLKNGDNIDFFVVCDETDLVFDFSPNNLSKKFFRKLVKVHGSSDGITHDSDLIVISIMNHYYSLNFRNNPIQNSNSLNYLSVIVPTLNEGELLKKVLSDLSLYNFFEKINLRYEVIVVDGAQDILVENHVKLLGKHFRYVRGSRVHRGQSISNGINVSRGNIIAIFPSDNEYKISDLNTLILSLLNNNYDLVIGNRSHNSQISNNFKVDRNFISYFGGVFASIILFLRTKIFCSDILSTMKAFKKHTIKDYKFKSKDLGFEAELIIAIVNSGGIMYELPVDYKGRSYSEGKKTTFFSGLTLISYLLFSSFKK